jgi:alkanesulfonate monooxygenase SsuD/methylene tetrahydromethanopterin reductase-like flavin-dependent oxidoreductase (luciferase family)
VRIDGRSRFRSWLPLLPRNRIHLLVEDIDTEVTRRPLRPVRLVSGMERLELFALGEHHTLDFAVSAPAVVLAAIAARTKRIRLTSAVTVLSALDPVRFYQDFAQLDMVSDGRAQLIAGRSACAEPFALFGHRVEDYDVL